MNDDQILKQMVQSSLDKNLNEIEFSSTMKVEVLEAVKKDSILERIKAVLDYEIEIPLSYAAVACLFIVGIFGYQVHEYLPDASEMAGFQLKWIVSKYKGVI